MDLVEAEVELERVATEEDHHDGEEDEGEPVLPHLSCRAVEPSAEINKK